MKNENEQKNEQKKWAWMVDYCLQHEMPPAQSWAWNQAKLAWEEQQKQASREISR